MDIKNKTVHIREVEGGPTPGRRIWHIYVGDELYDWLSEDRDSEAWKRDVLEALKEANPVSLAPKD